MQINEYSYTAEQTWEFMFLIAYEIIVDLALA